MYGFFEFALSWGPTIIFFFLVVGGFFYGFKEILECLDDLESVAENRLDHVPLDEDPRYEVARGNLGTSWKNTVVQLIFFLVTVMSTYFKIRFPSEYEQVNEARQFVLPLIFVAAEFLLVSQLKGMKQTRENVKKKARKILLDKENSDKKTGNPE